MQWLIGIIVVVVAILFSALMVFAARFKRCPSDKILVVYGRTQKGQFARCNHGGGVFVMPLIQDCAYLDLIPMTIGIPLENALSLQNIRVNVPSTFTVGVSTEPDVMANAAERLLGLKKEAIQDMVREIIFGQLRLTVASLTIEQINQDRESFLEAIRKNVEPELNKVGLYLINVNITDITDESGYIQALGKKAASEAINKARVDVAEQEKVGAIGQSEANKVREIRVAENETEQAKGKKAAEADRRVYLQQQETAAAVGEAEADRAKEIAVAENIAEADNGKKRAEAGRRVYVQEQESEAIKGENIAKANIAAYEAELAMRQAEAMQRGEVAKREALAEVQKAQYKAEQERLRAAEIVREEVERTKIEIAADAQAEKTRREARGQADAVLLRYQAEAEGLKKVLDAKAAGYRALVESCSGDSRAAATLLMIEKIEDVVARQVEAVKNLKIDKVTVWDSGAGDGKGSATANFVSSLIKSLPPIHDLARMAGVELPEYLGHMAEDGGGTKERGKAPGKP